NAAGQEGGDAARVVCLLVGGEQDAASPSPALAAATSAAAAPLMSHTPRPTTRLSRRRITCGSALQCGESGTVSRCTLNRYFGVPRTAYRLTAPAPWSTTCTSKPGRFARR